MVRSKTGVERMLNLVNAAHSAMKILPHHHACWKDFRYQSPQELRFVISEQIRKQVFFDTLRAKAETMGKSTDFSIRWLNWPKSFGVLLNVVKCC